MKALTVARSFEVSRTVCSQPTRRVLFDVARTLHSGRLSQTRRYSSANRFQHSSVSPNTPQRRHLGLLAAVAFFSTTLGYSISEWRPRIQSGQAASSPKYASQTEVDAAIEELKAAFPDKRAVITEAATLRTYGFSENSYHPSSPHSVVIHVKSTDDVSRVMKIANKYRVPVIPYGGGTSLEGHFSGVSGLAILGELQLTSRFWWLI